MNFPVWFAGIKVERDKTPLWLHAKMPLGDYGRQALSCKACGTSGMNFVQQNVVMCVVFPIFRKGEVRNFQSHQKKWLIVKRNFAQLSHEKFTNGQ